MEDYDVSGEERANAANKVIQSILGDKQFTLA